LAEEKRAVEQELEELEQSRQAEQRNQKNIVFDLEQTVNELTLELQVAKDNLQNTRESVLTASRAGVSQHSHNHNNQSSRRRMMNATHSRGASYLQQSVEHSQFLQTPGVLSTRGDLNKNGELGQLDEANLIRKLHQLQEFKSSTQPGDATDCAWVEEGRGATISRQVST